MWEECRESHCITINWMNDRNLNDFATKEDIRLALSKEKDGHGGAPFIWPFVHELRLGDIVVANNGLSRVEGMGIVKSGYLPPRHPKNPRKSKDYHCHARLVSWLIRDPVDLPRKLFNQPTVELLDAERCQVIKRAYQKQHPERRKMLDRILLPSDDFESEEAEDIEEIQEDPTIGPTTKEALIDARRGQGRFRQLVLKRWGRRCAITSSVTDEAIRASHIKPWSECTDEERLDPENGLPLVASLDALFDAGLISFDSAGLLIVSPKVSVDEQKLFGITKASLTRPPARRMAEYLAAHRRKHGFSK
jgi:hypothetical protein